MFNTTPFNTTPYNAPTSPLADTLPSPPPPAITPLSQVRAAYDGLLSTYLTLLSGGPKPDYSIDGQAVSWEGYLETLSMQMARLRQELMLLGDPCFMQSEIRSIGR